MPRAVPHPKYMQEGHRSCIRRLTDAERTEFYRVIDAMRRHVSEHGAQLYLEDRRPALRVVRGG
jgi:hypothetical protein